MLQFWIGRVVRNKQPWGVVNSERAVGTAIKLAKVKGLPNLIRGCLMATSSSPPGKEV